jgi:hypothetical protein
LVTALLGYDRIVYGRSSMDQRLAGALSRPLCEPELNQSNAFAHGRISFPRVGRPQDGFGDDRDVGGMDRFG